MYTKEFVLSVVLGNDIIPRLSLASMEKLKYALLDAIKKSKLPKVRIIRINKHLIFIYCKFCPYLGGR